MTEQDLADELAWREQLHADFEKLYGFPGFEPTRTIKPQLKVARRPHLRPTGASKEQSSQERASPKVRPMRPDSTRLTPGGVHSVSALLANPPEPPPMLLEGLIRRGDRVLLCAPRAIGKSWLMMQLAETVAAGAGAFLDTFPATASCNVLMLLGEASDFSVAQRWQLFGGGAENVHFTTARSMHVSVHEYWVDDYLDNKPIRKKATYAEISANLEATIEALEIGLLIVDPWAVFYRGEENSNDQVESALNELADLQSRTGVTVVLVHHFGKERASTAEPEDLGRGASRLADWAGVRITLRPHYGKDKKTAARLGDC